TIDARGEIGESSAPCDGEGAEADAKNTRDEHRGEGQLDGRGHPARDFIDDRPLGEDRRPHVPGEDVAKVPEELDVERIVEAQLGLDAIDQLRVPSFSIVRALGVPDGDPLDDTRDGAVETM